MTQSGNRSFKAKDVVLNKEDTFFYDNEMGRGALESVLRVVNLTKNYILSAGMKGVFSKKEGIAFFNYSIEEVNISSFIDWADVVIIEKSIAAHPKVKELKENKHSLIFYLDLEANKVNLVLNRNYDLNCVDDLVHLVQAKGRLI